MNDDLISATELSADGSEALRLTPDSTAEEIQYAAEKLRRPVEDVQRTVDSLRAYVAAHVARYEDCTPTRLNTAGHTVRVRYTPNFPMGSVILNLLPQFAVATRGLTLPVFHIAAAPTSYYRPTPDPTDAGRTLHMSTMAELRLVGHDEKNGTWLFEHTTEGAVILTGLLLDAKSNVLDTCDPHMPYGLLQCGSVHFKVTTTDVLPPRAYITYRSLESFRKESGNRTIHPDDLPEADVTIDADGEARVMFWQSATLCGIVSVPLGARVESVTATQYDQTQTIVGVPYVADLEPLDLLLIKVVGAPAGSQLRLRYGKGMKGIRSALISTDEDGVAHLSVDEGETVTGLYALDVSEGAELPQRVDIPEPNEDGTYTIKQPTGDFLVVLSQIPAANRHAAFTTE